jgi:hypothetical protein
VHIHVQSADGEAKIWLEPHIELARNHGLSEQDLTRTFDLVRDHSAVGVVFVSRAHDFEVDTVDLLQRAEVIVVPALVGRAR